MHKRPDVDLSKIPPELIERYGAEVFINGQTSIYWRRQEIGINNPPPARPQPVEIPPAEDQPTENKPEDQTTSQTIGVKIWPSIVLSAFQSNRGGAVRLYFLARSLDRDGRGWIKADDLVDYSRSLKIGERKRQRWQSDAVNMGLFVEKVFRKNGERVYFLAGLHRSARAFECEHIGRPAAVDAENLVAAGWRSLVWSAYLTTLNDRPISQQKKAELTGISDRTQRNYQANQPGDKIRNYTDRGRAGRGRVDGMRENTDMVVFEHRGRIVQKLPDIRVVPRFVASRLPRGRSRKAQAALNDNLSRVRQVEISSGVSRLFCESAKQVKSTLRHLIHAYDIPPWDRPLEVFEHVDNRRNVNRWRAVPVCEAVA